MASKRNLQVAEIIKRNMGMVFFQEGPYIYGDALVTVTNVQVTPDMSQSKIYLSIYNTDDKNAVVEMVQQHTHRLRQLLAHRIKKHVRRIPTIHFFIDETLDEMYRLNALFDNIHEEE
ncbi:30S ribosome-binding factor RbfA [Portibacter marinus]|uniref:30S ribosome-binding factor RbfA n=1 Tax=Portibacter marinus TaxID=2898660 RepID=UPI001F2A0E97|nr:30S ribosome-binding factor RbfA [Portibacter marinus]